MLELCEMNELWIGEDVEMYGKWVGIVSSYVELHPQSWYTTSLAMYTITSGYYPYLEL